MATIQKRKNKNGSTSYRVMIRPSDGLPAMSKTLPTYQEAKDWAAIEEGKRRQGIYFPEKLKQKHTLNELIDRYIEIVLPSIKSAEDVLRHLNWWKKHIGKYTLQHVSSDLISKQRKNLLDEELFNDKKRTTATVNRYLASLSAVLSYGVKECEWITANPMFRVRKLQEARGRDRVLSPQECLRLFNACRKSSNPLLYPFVLIAITTGARSGELLKLEWQHVDLDKGLIHLKDTKNGRPRILAVVDQALAVLKELHTKRKLDQLLVFPSKTRFGRLTLRKPWKKALEEAGIRNFRMHDLRHCFATYASESGASNIQLSTATGHETLSQLKRYCHPDADIVKELSKSVHDRIFSNQNSEKNNAESQQGYQNQQRAPVVPQEPRRT